MGYAGSAVIFFLLSAAAALAIHYHYVKRSHKRIPVLTHIFIVASNFVCLLPFPILVLDVDAALTSSSVVTTNTDGTVTAQDTEPWFRDLWYSIMGITQVMAWVLLPIAQEYDCSGEFQWKRRLRRAIKENVKMYIIMGIVVGLLFAYIVFLKGLKTFTQIVQLGVAAANAFGLLLIIIFLASGLVGVPKLLWRMSDPEIELRRHFFDAPDIQEDLDIAAMELAEVKAELVSLDPRVSDEDRPYLTEMLEIISDTDRDVPLYHTRNAQRTLENIAAGVATDISQKHLEELNTRLKRAVKVATRMNYLWDSSVRQCKLLDRVIHGNIVKSTSSGSTTVSTFQRFWISFRNPIFKILAVGAFLLTVLVLYSELILPFQATTTQTLSFIELVMQSKIHFIGSVTFLFYMAACSYWATFQFKVFETFHIIPSVSDAASLCFTATFLTRLIMPLCYNFLMIAGLVSSDSRVVYSKVFGSMDVAQILGSWFNTYLPIFIPCLAVLIQTKVFHRLLLLVGVEWEDVSDTTSDTVQQKIHDGRRLIMTAAGRELQVVSTTAAATNNGSGPSSVASAAVSAVSSAVASVTGGATATAKDTNEDRGKRYKEYLAQKAAKASENS